MSNKTHDPAIEQEAERMLQACKIEGIDCNAKVRLRDVMPLLLDLATLRRKAAAPLSDARLREIEERAAKATKGPFFVITKKDPFGNQTEYLWQKVGFSEWDSSLIERREDAEFYSNALADIDTLLAALRSRGEEGEKST